MSDKSKRKIEGGLRRRHVNLSRKLLAGVFVPSEPSHFRQEAETRER